MNHFYRELLAVNGTEYRGLSGSDIEQLNEGDTILLKREPDNPCDVNAIMVLAGGFHIGYIPRRIANARLAHILDTNHAYQASLYSIKPQYKRAKFKIELTTFPIKSSDSTKKNKGFVTPDSGIAQTRERFSQNHKEQMLRYKGISGIYQIRCKNGLRYIGQSTDIATRWRWHITQLNYGFHCNDKLQQDWSRLGAKKFKFEVLEELPLDDLDAAEVYYISMFNSFNHGYNATVDGQPRPYSENCNKSVSINRGGLSNLQHNDDVVTTQSFDDYSSQIITSTIQKKEQQSEKNNDLSVKLSVSSSQKIEQNIDQLDMLSKKFGAYLADLELYEEVIQACIKRRDQETLAEWKYFQEVSHKTKSNLIRDIELTLRSIKQLDEGEKMDLATLYRCLASAAKTYKTPRELQLKQIFNF